MNEDNEIESAIQEIYRDFPDGIRLFDPAEYDLENLIDAVLTAIAPGYRKRLCDVDRELVFFEAFAQIDAIEKSNPSESEELAALVFSQYLLNLYGRD